MLSEAQPRPHPDVTMSFSSPAFPKDYFKQTSGEKGDKDHTETRDDSLYFED